MSGYYYTLKVDKQGNLVSLCPPQGATDRQMEAITRVLEALPELLAEAVDAPTQKIQRDNAWFTPGGG